MFSWVVASVDAKVILASEGVRAALEDVDSHVIFVNEMSYSSLSGQPLMLPTTSPEYDDTACILFNAEAVKSHKAITYTHGALATACLGQGPVLRINQSSRVMQLSSYSVDIALSEVFTTLVNGACVCIEHSAKLADFATAARRMNVNWTYLTPTLSRRLQPESLPNIAVVCFRTRQLDDDTYGQWAGKAKVLMAYGSAEACILGLSASEVRDASAVMCIGSPFCGNFWVVNPEDSNKLMPVGAVGELVISSPTLATGHELDRETKNWFVKTTANSNSKSQGPGRLLKTGHYVRYREHGQIELVSAHKEKTEINGRIVQTAEVERRLRRCVGQSVDVAVEKIAFNYKDSDSTPILAAFVELGDNLFHGPQDLTNLSGVAKETLHLAKTMAEMALRDTLPSHMIPSTFIPVRQMPLTASLEINRLALQKMITGLSKSQLLGLTEVANPHAVQAARLNPLPLTMVEERIRAIWASILDISESSITSTDGLIGLGGDRDLAHDVVIACRQQGISISVVDMLRNMSLNDLCRGITISDLPVSHVEPNRYLQPSPSNAFIEDTIVPQIGFDRDAIEDVAEASALQTMFVESGMLKTKENISYFLFSVNGQLDLGKLENACYLLAKAHPILRTAFTSHNRQVFQTVIRSYQPDFQRYQCNSWRLGGLVKKLVQRERDTVPIDFRQPVTKWSFLDAGKSSILVLRLSRAQYSDISLPVLIKDLSKLYEQGDLRTIRTGFCDVVRSAQAASLSGATDYWKTLLDGSMMTEVLAKPSPVAPNSDSKSIHQQIPAGSLKALGIPFETILKGAWSIVLGCLSGKTDVVFGQLVEGKQIPDTLGPSGNIIPVRSRIPSAAVSPWEYLRGVQSQHVASIPHENMPFTDIVSSCTNWPCWTRFSTVVQHQNHGERENLNSNFSMGAATCRLSFLETNQSQNSDLFVRSIMAGTTNVDISLTFSEKRIHPFFAHEVLSMLCSTISLMTSAFIMEPIMLVDMLKTKGNSRSAPRIPLPSVKRDAQIMAPVISVLPDHASAIHTVISTGWDVILGAHSLRVSDDIRSVPFYTFSPSLVPAGELARYYTESMPLLNIPDLAQASFTLEEILDHPTMMKQYELIISKQIVPQLRRNSSFVQRSWTKNIRRLAGTGINVGSSSPPPPGQTGNRRSDRSSGNSMESMTTGSSLSDEEMHDEVLPLTPMMMPKRKSGLMSLEVKKRSSQILGRIKLSQSS
jgi:acyl-CoA synthetase (AMP-forming)/AMP-acid ligase II